MDGYHALKLIHVVSASILFGTGIGTAFFMLRGYLGGNREAFAVTARNVVLADWLFTTPAVIVQFVTGLWLAGILGVPLGSLWFALVIGLFVVVGLCWIPVVVIQVRIRAAMREGRAIEEIRPLMRAWVALGIPAFVCMLALYFLMVTKHGLGTILFRG
ncbi:MAG: DUF2269 family protein [Burkholderiales bacterium]